MIHTRSADLIERWLDDLRRDRAPQTIKRYRSALRRFCAWYARQEQQDLAIEDLTPITLVGYRNTLQTMAATSTVNTHLAALRTWCVWLTTAGYISTNPAQRLKFVQRTEPTAPQALTGTHVHVLLQAAQRTRYPARDYAVIQVLLQTGIRISECAALTWTTISFGEKHGRLTIQAGKGNKARTVPLNRSARQALTEYLAPRLKVPATLRAVAAAWPHPPTPAGHLPFWSSQKGGALSISAMERMIAGVVKQGAARQLLPATTTAHTLRHTFATAYLAANPGDLVGLARLLGHSSVETTKIYVQPTTEELAQRVEGTLLNAYG